MPAPHVPLVARVDETDARRILLVRACEVTEVDAALWSPEDRAWASRLARETAGADAPAAVWLAERARHACERLVPRDARLAAWLRRGHAGAGHAGVLALVAVAALVLGLLADSLGGQAQINLLAPPVLAVLAWNGLVYVLVGARTLRPGPAIARRPLLQALARRLAGGASARAAGSLPALGADWAARAAPLAMARVALMLHVAAAALAAGLIAGLYVRGLVLDYRVVWQSTFLDADAVHRLLAALLGPAAAVTGIALPDAAGIAALRVVPGAAAPTSATGAAAAWIHLHAATLALGVVVPRLALALVAGVVARRRSRRFEIALAEPYFKRLLNEAGQGQAGVQVLPHGGAPTAQAALGLRAVLAAALGEPLVLAIEPATAYGAEEGAPPPPPPGTTLRVVLVDLAATPEPEAHGRFVHALAAPRLPLVLLADRTALRQRFATLPARLAEREALWRRFAAEHGLAFVAIDLEMPDAAGAAAALQAAMAASR